MISKSKIIVKYLGLVFVDIVFVILLNKDLISVEKNQLNHIFEKNEYLKEIIEIRIQCENVAFTLLQNNKTLKKTYQKEFYINVQKQKSFFSTILKRINEKIKEQDFKIVKFIFIINTTNDKKFPQRLYRKIILDECIIRRCIDLFGKLESKCSIKKLENIFSELKILLMLNNYFVDKDKLHIDYAIIDLDFFNSLTYSYVKNLKKLKELEQEYYANNNKKSDELRKIYAQTALVTDYQDEMKKFKKDTEAKFKSIKHKKYKL